ncbi:predicted protein [Monosiga brevicollis MX1]|uniref:Major facilitator superfamily (MFS) profile domain-containing protein n=1 Tax=Monosiga brevicollis TaxID=81824 RepID=A9V0M3_MONBE|nr:predicted protein [Monosiga brevicollis MX1]|eukprot:XP_001746146.1 hypothetical protein [Monosiga brevicollis MX1]
MCMFVAALTSLLLGYDQGVMSGAKLYIRRDLGLNDDQVQLVVGILHVSAVGALCAGWIADTLGRRMAVGSACVLFLAGGLLMALANEYTTLIVGRVVTGLGVGTGLTIAPLYMAELAPASVRGALVSLNEISINIGVLLGYLNSWAFSGLPVSQSWRWMLGLGCLPPVVIMVALFFMPESPRYLLRRGRRDEAFRVLARSCPVDEAKATLATLADEAQQPLGSWRDLLSPSMRGARWLILAGVGVAFFQQASGLEALLYYVPETLAHAGITSLEHQLLINMAVGGVKLLSVLIAMCFTDKYGRRTLLMGSGVGIMLSCLLVAISFEAGDILGLTLLGIFLFMATFSFGFGPLTWVVSSEIFPLQVRGPALGLATFVNRVVSGIITSTYLSMAQGLTPAGSFFLFAGLSLLSVAFVKFVVPETGGKTLEDIERDARVERESGEGPMVDDARCV